MGHGRGKVNKGARPPRQFHGGCSPEIGVSADTTRAVAQVDSHTHRGGAAVGFAAASGCCRR